MDFLKYCCQSSRMYRSGICAEAPITFDQGYSCACPRCNPLGLQVGREN